MAASCKSGSAQSNAMKDETDDCQRERRHVSDSSRASGHFGHARESITTDPVHKPDYGHSLIEQPNKVSMNEVSLSFRVQHLRVILSTPFLHSEAFHYSRVLIYFEETIIK